MSASTYLKWNARGRGDVEVVELLCRCEGGASFLCVHHTHLLWPVSSVHSVLMVFIFLPAS
jgi:hypothetical protein